MSNNTTVPLSIPEINGREWDYVKDCLDSGWVSSLGKYVSEFERKLAQYVGAKYAVACVNGTAALHISLIVAGVEQENEVIIPTVTFIAPVNAVKYVGANPVFMDCDDHLNIDVSKTKVFFEKECSYKNRKLINKRTRRTIKAILPVHVFGHPVDIEPLMELAGKYNLKVIEDATESLGSYYVSGKYKGKKTGTIGHIGCYSFNGNKIITSGGGGMIVTDDQKMAERAHYLTNQAKDDSSKYIHNEIGYNYRLTNIQAALGLAQLEQLDNFIKIKRKNFRLYDKSIKNIKGLRMIEEPQYAYSNYWFYSLVVDKAKYGKTNLDLMSLMEANGIQTRPLWYLSHMQKPYKVCLAHKIEKAEKIHKQVLNLPCSVNLTIKDIDKVIEEIDKWARK